MRASAFSPAHITGFFEIKLAEGDPIHSGSRGAGFSTSLGVKTEVEAERNGKRRYEVSVNKQPQDALPVSFYVLDNLLRKAEPGIFVKVNHEVAVPIGSGFGSSGAGALSLALALNEVLGLGLTRLEAAQIAHEAEIVSKTGLGTVIAEEIGGLEVRTEPGAPGVGAVNRLKINPGYLAMALHFGPISTYEALTNPEYFSRINGLGGRLVENLASTPSVDEFMRLSRLFSDSCGFATPRMRDLMAATDSNGFTSSMAMFGETVFVLVRREESSVISKIFSDHASQDSRLLVSTIDNEGARVL